MNSITFEEDYYLYEWKEDTNLLSIYDSKMCSIKTVKAAQFGKESETVQKTVVLALIEAVCKKQKAEELLADLF